MDWTAFITAILGVLLGGGLVALLKLKPDLAHIRAETSNDNAEAAQAISEAWSKVIEPLNSRVNDQQDTITRMQREMDEMKKSMAVIQGENRALQAQLVSERAERKAEQEDCVRRRAEWQVKEEAYQTQIAGLNEELAILRAKRGRGTG